jgi:hypothetical protein
MNWMTVLVPRLMRILRAIHPRIWFIVEPGPWSGLEGLKALEAPYPDPRVIYSAHMWSPQVFTHQGVGDEWAAYRDKVSYPGPVPPGGMGLGFSVRWDRAKIAEFIKKHTAWIRKHQARLLVGEFGVARWAKGRELWLKDVISVLEEQKYDWTFMSIAGWNGWNPTFGPDAPESLLPYGGEETESLKVLLDGWALNRSK